MGRGRRHLHGPPFTLLCLHPLSLEPWRGETGPPVPAHRLPRVHRSAGSQHPACMDLVQSHLGARGQNFRDQAAFPRGLTPPQESAETCLAPAWSSLGPADLDPNPRECRAFSACVRVAVSVFIRMSLFKKQPSLWGSWTLHVRVSPLPIIPLPRVLPSPHPISSQLCCSLQRKGLWETPGLFPPIPQFLPAGTACMPSPEPRGTPYPFPFPLLTKEKKEFQTSTRLCGLALYPQLCCQLAPCVCVEGGGRAQTEPRTEGYPPVLPGFTLLLCVAVFSTTTCCGIFLPTEGFSHEVNFWPVFPESQPLSAHPSPFLARGIPTSRADNCLPVCLEFHIRTFLPVSGPQ